MRPIYLLLALLPVMLTGCEFDLSNLGIDFSSPATWIAILLVAAAFLPEPFKSIINKIIELLRNKQDDGIPPPGPRSAEDIQMQDLRQKACDLRCFLKKVDQKAASAIDDHVWPHLIEAPPKKSEVSA